MILNEEQVREVAERAEKATPGPWTTQIEPDEDSCMDKYVYQVMCPPETILPMVDLNDYNRGDEELEASTQFIAHSRTDIPNLCETIAAHKAEEAGLRELLWISHGCPQFALYGDDGRMACNQCLIDFKNTPYTKIRDIWIKRNVAILEAANFLAGTK